MRRRRSGSPARPAGEGRAGRPAAPAPALSAGGGAAAVHAGLAGTVEVVATDPRRPGPTSRLTGRSGLFNAPQARVHARRVHTPRARTHTARAYTHRARVHTPRARTHTARAAGLRTRARTGAEARSAALCARGYGPMLDIYIYIYIYMYVCMYVFVVRARGACRETPFASSRPPSALGVCDYTEPGKPCGRLMTFSCNENICICTYFFL
jgi:hypothetical protein